MIRLLAQTPPVFELVRSEPPRTSSGWLWWALAALVAVAIGAFVLVTMSRRAVPEPSPRAAYRALVRRMRLGRPSRGLLTDLAEAHGSASPLALIGSGSAFERAVRAMGPLPERRARALRRLERRVVRERQRIHSGG